MRPFRVLACFLILGVASVAVHTQTGPARSAAVIYEGARLIVGDAATPPIAAGAFVVENGVITAIGRTGAVTAPAGAARVDLSGKTVMPALIDVHTHFGYEKYTRAAGDSRAEHYTPENLYDHFQRAAYYGVGTVHDGGTASVPISLQFQMDQRAGKYPNAAAYASFSVGIVPPDGGPDDILIKGTRPLHAQYEVTRAREARAAVKEIASKNIRHIKIWIGDRNETYPAMPHQVYEAVIDDAHKNNIKVHAHAMTLRDQKDIVRAGADLLVHIITNTKLDDEMLALVREKRPYWVPSIGTGVPSLRREVCENEPFTTAVLPANILADILANECRQGGANAEREAALRASFTAMRNAGARVVLGTDAGIRPSKTFGSADHHELTTFVRLGMSTAEAIEAGTTRAAELLGLSDVGALAAGKRADFLVLDANPLDDILNTRKISAVYLRGARLDRDALLAQWKATNISR
jgi:imidazolonepropionase-like amidohydrolase